jgi:hypothetical protein
MIFKTRQVPGGTEIVISMSHPQWGGYASQCEVSFLKEADGEPGCFDVANWNNGHTLLDIRDEPDRKHYCAATQVIRFAITVLEAQCAHQVVRESPPFGAPPAGTPVRCSKDEIQEFIKRLQALPTTEK